MLDTDVMKPASENHHQIGKVVLGISEDILHNPRALDAGDGMFHSHTNSCDLTIALLLFSGQLFLVGLFFG